MSILFGGSSSPWNVPSAWDSIQIGGVVYGTAGPPTSTLMTQEIAVGLTTQQVPTTQFLPVGGKVRIRGAERFYKVDIKNPPGSDGWTITYRGIEPKRFEIDFYIWTQAQYDYFTGSVIPAIYYSGTKKQVQALQVFHPALSAVNITQIFVNSIGAIEQISDDLMFRCTVKVSEYLNPPPLNTTTTPLGAKVTAPAANPGVQPPTAVQQLVNVRNNRAAALANGGAIPSGFQGPL